MSINVKIFVWQVFNVDANEAIFIPLKAKSCYKLCRHFMASNKRKYLRAYKSMSKNLFTSQKMKGREEKRCASLTHKAIGCFNFISTMLLLFLLASLLLWLKINLLSERKRERKSIEENIRVKRKLTTAAVAFWMTEIEIYIRRCQ